MEEPQGVLGHWYLSGRELFVYSHETVENAKVSESELDTPCLAKGK